MTHEPSQDIERGKYSVVIVGPKLLVHEKSAARVLLSQVHFSKKVLALVVDEAHKVCSLRSVFD